MRIAIDCTSLFDQYSFRGIGNYTLNLLNSLLTDQSHEWHLIGFLSAKQTFERLNPKLSNQTNIHFHSVGAVRTSILDKLIWGPMTLRPILKKIKPDIYFCPNFERTPIRGSWKNITVIHDLIPLQTGIYSAKSSIHNLIKGLFYKHLLNKSLRNSHAIVTISQTAKKSISTTLKIPDELIFAIPLGIGENKVYVPKDKRYEKQIFDRYGINGEYILYFGGIESNKNLEYLLQAFQKFAFEMPAIRFVCVSSEWSRSLNGKVTANSQQAKRLNDLTHQLGIDNQVIFTGFAHEHDLPIMIHYAKLVVHLSQNEGFGIAALEAICNAKQVLLSRIPVYEELFNEYAHFTSLDSVEGTATDMLQLMKSKPDQKILDKQAELARKQYSWDRTAEATLNIFQKRLSLNKYIQPQFRKPPKDTNTEKFKGGSPPIENSPDVLFVAPFAFPFKGGVELYISEIARRLAFANYKVSVLTHKHLPNLEKIENRFGYQIVRMTSFFQRYYYARFNPELFICLMKSNARIIHAQGFGFWWHDICLIIKRFTSKRKITFVNTPHGPFMARSDYSRCGKLIKIVFTRIQRIYLNWLYDYIMQVNPYQAQWLANEYKISPEKIKFLPLGIDEYHLRQTRTSKKLRDELRMGEKSILISFTGRFHEYKGVFTLLHAIKYLHNDLPGVKFALIGNDAGALENMKRFIVENKLNQTVTIFENPNDNIRDQILDISEIFIFPGEWEAYGLAMLEAMAHGNAIIATPTEGARYLIEENKNGKLFPFGDSKILAETIRSLIQHDKIRGEMIKNNTKKATGLSWDKIWNTYEEMYALFIARTKTS